jgi:hypothetical protein
VQATVRLMHSRFSRCLTIRGSPGNDGPAPLHWKKLFSEAACPHMSLAAIGWLFTAGVLAHNLEEAISLPAWSSSARRWYRPVGRSEFRFAAAVLSAVLIVVAACAAVTRPGGVAAYLMAGYVLAMVLNTFVPHVLASVIMRKYMPGTATALVFNLPLGVWYLERAFSEAAIEPRVFVWAGPIIVMAIVASLPGLFALGRQRFSGSGPG